MVSWFFNRQKLNKNNILFLFLQEKLNGYFLATKGDEWSWATATKDRGKQILGFKGDYEGKEVPQKLLLGGWTAWPLKA